MADDEDENRDSKPATSPTSSSSAEGSTWWGSWGQGWIDTVKEKSAQTMQMVKKDLNEFVEVIQGDTSVAISETAEKIKDEEEEDGTQVQEDNFASIQSATKVVKKGMANFLHSVSEFMAIPPDDTREEVITVSDFPSSSQYDRRQEKLRALQIDPGTYCNEPEGLFNDWLEVFNLDDNKLDMSNMLVQNPAIRGIYTQLVPAVVSHTTFWQRYYYQVFLLDAEEKKRQEIVARANTNSNEDDTESGWGDDDDDDDDGIEVLSSSIALTTTGAMDYSIINADNSNNVDVSVTDVEHDIVSINETALDDDSQTVVPEKTVDQEHVIESSTESSVCTESQSDNSAEATKSQGEVLAEKCNELDTPPCKHPKSMPETDNLQCEQVESSKKGENLSEGQMLEISSDIIDISCNVETESDNETIQGNIEEVSGHEPIAASAQGPLIPNEKSETSSLSSWMSIDDVIKVKKINGEQEVKSDSNGASANVSTDSNGVIINKSDIIDESDEDFDLDIEDDVNEEEVAKMVEEIKNMAHGGAVEDDDDWENWE